MSTTFKPAWWLNNPHLQTLWPALIRQRLKNLTLTRERLELPDGDFIDLEWLGAGQRPIVIVLHGLEGSIDSHYAKGMLQTLNHSGWQSVFMHFRGCSGEPNRLPRSYHSGDTGDLDSVVRILRERNPSQPIAAIGFSLGGNVLLKWLGETEGNNPLCAAIAISVPFQLDKAVQRMQQGFSRLYEKHFLKCLCERMASKHEKISAGIDLPSWSSLRTLYDFDNQVTAPLHGFGSADEYYERSSSRQYLNKIKIPTLLLQAKDDPFMLAGTIPLLEELSASTQLEVTEGGGHVGFVSGKYPWRAEYWLESRVPEFLHSYIPK